MGREERMDSTMPVTAGVCCLTYMAAMGFIAFSFYQPWDENFFDNGFFAHAGATCIIFFFSAANGNSSLYDPAWVFLPLGVCAGWMSQQEYELSYRALYAYALLVVWFVRYNYMHPWDGWTHGIENEDWRYVELAKYTGEDNFMYWIFI